MRIITRYQPEMWCTRPEPFCLAWSIFLFLTKMSKSSEPSECPWDRAWLYILLGVCLIVETLMESCQGSTSNTGATSVVVKPGRCAKVTSRAFSSTTAWLSAGCKNDRHRIWRGVPVAGWQTCCRWRSERPARPGPTPWWTNWAKRWWNLCFYLLLLFCEWSFCWVQFLRSFKWWNCKLDGESVTRTRTDFSAMGVRSIDTTMVASNHCDYAQWALVIEVKHGLQQATALNECIARYRPTNQPGIQPTWQPTNQWTQKPTNLVTNQPVN